ncbi:MAG: hypothetical protein R2849_17200 [Thermomicrobiales bacterium]
MDKTALEQSGLSSRQIAGQRVIYSYPGLELPESLLQAVRDGEAAGVIFFGENITSAEQIASVAQQLQDAQRASEVPAPLLLMTDQEGRARTPPAGRTRAVRKTGRHERRSPPLRRVKLGPRRGKRL